MRRLAILCMLLFILLCGVYPVSAQPSDAEYILESYTKIERSIPMRDGVKLFTSIYVPNDTLQRYPIMLTRTPYGVGPYGEEAYKTRLGPSMLFAKEGFIFAYQDVRGRYMSEGEFEAVRPHNPDKTGKSDVDESSDTYDTIEWLFKNLPNNNGRVGTWGISASGFYTTHTIIDAHPALKAASPQAPVTDWFLGDDRHHNGAFMLQASFSFLSYYGVPRSEPNPDGARGFQDYGTPDGYQWYLKLGPLSNVNEKYMHGDNKIWNAMVEHGTYDSWWQARTPLPHLTRVKVPTMVVGGFFDAQDLYGPLKTYAAIEKDNSGVPNFLVMGPWWHGGWARADGDRYQDIYFDSKTSLYYREHIELPFFSYYLKDKSEFDFSKATIFISGSNEWRSFEQWPPGETNPRNLYLHPNGGLSLEMPADTSSYSEYVSDPNKPVPHTPHILIHRDDRYVVQDQRYASTRPDVLVYESGPLKENLSVVGDLYADLYVSTTGTDADYIVKLIDVYPDTAQYVGDNPHNVKMGGFQFMVRGEVMRAKFRNSFQNADPMEPGEITEIEFDMQDVAHTFLKDHKIMVQVQSTWFPMVDRNPQKFMDIYSAHASDYQIATHRIYTTTEFPSHLRMKILEE